MMSYDEVQAIHKRVLAKEDVPIDILKEAVAFYRQGRVASAQPRAVKEKKTKAPTAPADFSIFDDLAS